MRYYIIAGEASGDMHAANLISALQQRDATASFRFFGGDRMAAVAGHPPTCHIQDLAFMGFVEILTHLRTILGLLSQCKADILDFEPDALILVDYPGFNIRMAQWAKKRNIPAFYYISPQVWAWKKGRVHTIMQNVEQLYAILPFEPDFYQGYGYEIAHVGHPLLEEMQKDQSLGFAHPRSYVALLPGSRKQEVQRLMPVMVQVAQAMPQQDFVVAAAPTISVEALERYTQGQRNIFIVPQQTYSILQNAKAAIVTSGTATLETALFQVPQVVVYKGSPLSYWIAKRLVDIPFISLPNLIQGEAVVPELIQGECTAQNIAAQLAALLDDTSEARQDMLAAYRSLSDKIDQGGASALVAEDITRRLGA